MSNEELDEQLAICDAATPGPWPHEELTEWEGPIPDKCIRFIAAARTGYPAALSDLKAERAAYAVRASAYSQALDLWQKEHPKAVIPYRADLCVWLIGELKLARAEIRRSWCDGYDELRRE